eukprot:m.56998 g.56998  ORF g.56998 m.56998 type:complete len:263 (+) comp48986_c0_seq1:55-843(+)
MFRLARAVSALARPTLARVPARLASSSVAITPLKLGDTFPNYDVETTHGSFKIHDFFGEKWGLLCSHPQDFTPVCTTELAMLTNIIPEFEKRNVKLIAISCNDVATHRQWAADILSIAGKPSSDGDAAAFPYPIIADPTRKIVTQLGMLDPVLMEAPGLPFPARCVFLIGPDKTLKFSILYPATTGRNFVEVLRAIDSVQLTQYHKVATPVNWTQGEPCIVVPAVKNEDLPTLFPKGVKITALPSGKQYLRYTPQPDTERKA